MKQELPYRRQVAKEQAGQASSSPSITTSRVATLPAAGLWAERWDLAMTPLTGGCCMLGHFDSRVTGQFIRRHEEANLQCYPEPVRTLQSQGHIRCNMVWLVSNGYFPRLCGSRSTRHVGMATIDSQSAA